MHLRLPRPRTVVLAAAPVLTAVLVVLLPPPAPVLAATRTAVDLTTHVHYRLAGRDLTVGLDPQTPPELAERLQGRRIRFACARGGDVTSVVRRWPASARTVHVRLPRPVDQAVVCSLQPAGAAGELSSASFD